MELHQAAFLKIQSYQKLKLAVNKILQEYNLSVFDWVVLRYITTHDSPRLIDVAKEFNVEKPVITIIIKRFVKKKLISIEPSKTDKRAKLIGTLDLGKEIIKEIDSKLNILLGKVLKGIKEEEIKIYFKVLEQIKKGLTETIEE